MKRGVLCVAAAALVVRLAVFAVSSGDLGERLRQARRSRRKAPPKRTRLRLPTPSPERRCL